MINRRDFARTMTGAVAAGAGVLALPDVAFAKAAEAMPFKLSIMLWTIYRDMPFPQRLEKVHEAGYSNVELVGEFTKWSDQDWKDADRTKKKLGITYDCTAGLKHGAADPSTRDAFLEDLKNFIPLAERLECPEIIVMSGNKVEGVSREAQHDACVESLKRAMDIAAPKNITLLLENIDPEENPKYYLTSVAEGFEIVRKVDNPHMKFLYDFFHEQIAEGNLIEKLEKNIDYVGTVHIADVPGRHHPGTGEINYANIYRKLAELKFNRHVAMEFLPLGDPVQELRAAREEVARSIKGVA